MLEPHPKHDDRYILALQISVAFRNQRFNTPSYLRSISELQVNDDWAKPYMQKFQLQSISSDGLRGVLVVQASEGIRSAKWLHLRFGPQLDSVSLSQLQWSPRKIREPYGEDPSWWLSRAHTKIEISDPTWPILIDASLARLTDANRDQLHLTVHNLSTTAVAFQQVVIDVIDAQEKGLCPAGANDERQTVALDWNQLTRTMGKSGAWTTIGQDTLLIAAEVSGDRCSSRPLVHIPIPTRLTVAQGEMGSLTLTLWHAGAATLRQPVQQGTVLVRRVAVSARDVGEYLRLPAKRSVTVNIRVLPEGQAFPSVLELIGRNPQ